MWSHALWSSALSDETVTLRLGILARYDLEGLRRNQGTTVCPAEDLEIWVLGPPKGGPSGAPCRHYRKQEL